MSEEYNGAMKNGKIADPKFLPPEFVERRIYLVRGKKVMLDADLAELYGVETKALNRAVQRNKDRFPADFIFRLTAEESESLRFQFGISNVDIRDEVLRCQFGTSKEGRGGRRYLPYVFTEHGVAMLSSVLNSKRAVQTNILIVRIFMKMRQLLENNKELAERVAKLEVSTKRHASVLVILVNDIRKLTDPPLEPDEPKEPIGFHVRE